MDNVFSSLLPKKQINSDIFLNENAGCDGRATRIAIWDTGIDPTAAGLQITPDGKPKIVDMIDASGSGDVKMKCKRYINQKNRIIETLTGRKVKIPSHWNPSDGIIRIGVKPASELFPKLLLQRLRNENRDNFWRPYIKRLAANLACDFNEAEEYLNQITQHYKCISNCDENKSNPTKSIRSDPINSPDKLKLINQNLNTVSLQTNPNLNPHSQQKNGLECKQDKFDLSVSNAKVQLKNAARHLEESLILFDQYYSPMEIVYDCFVFHNGNDWVACIDTSPYNSNTTLSDLPLLRDFTINHEYASFGEQTQLYYTVKIFNNGNLLQIVTNNSSHGTHVASIASAYFPNDDHQLKNSPTGMFCFDRNGVAPGAEIVSIKISDSRLGPMETGISLLRAIRWTIELKCDIVNYSFGEQVIWPNIGRISKYLNRMIHKYGIIMVASGGNNGPSLGSLSCPGGTVQGVIGVAPLVFPDMMHYLYCQPCDVNCSYDNQSSVVENTKPTAYNWGSRGPALDGALGLCVAAPGGANTSVASWQLKPASVLSGSSMSAPMVSGGISLLLSGIRHRYKCTADKEPLKIPPSLIYHCLMNTSKSCEHLSYLDQGYGLMQIDAAFNYLNTVLHKLYQQNQSITTSLCTNVKNINGVDHVDDNEDDETLSMSLNVKNSSRKLLPIPDPCIMYGWHIRLTVSGPGCTLQNRGIWLRRGWLLSPRAVVGEAPLPLLRYTINMNIEFDEYVPINIRQNIELHLSTEIISDFNKFANSNGWLQIAPLITITNTSRLIQFVIDPNRFNQLLYEKVKEDLSDHLVNDHHHHQHHHNTQHPIEEHHDISSLSEDQLQSDVCTDHRRQQPQQQSQSQYHLQQNELTNFCWPSSKINASMKHQFNAMPIHKSQEPYVSIIQFNAINYPELHCLANLPIIIQIPYKLDRNCCLEQPRFLFSDRFDVDNKVRRWFIEVPHGATAGVLRLARLDDEGDKSCEFTITINSPCIGMELDSQEIRWTSIELNKCGQTKSTIKRSNKCGSTLLSSDDFDCASQFGFPIKWETDCIELTIAQSWGLEMPAIVIGELYFRGLEPSSKNIVLNTSDRYCRIGLRSNFMNESIQPDIWLTHWCLPVKPYDSKIFYLGHGKNELLLNDCGSYALRLMYRFSCPFKTATTIISLPWLQDMLYTSDYLIHIFHIYDHCGRFIGAGEYDGHRAQRPKFTFNLQKGDYKVIAQICHESGPSLKRGPLKSFTAPSSPSGNELSFMADEYKNVNSFTINSNWSPLQSLQNIPIIVNFRLTGSMELANGKLGGSCLTGQSIVQFEFSAFPSSLNLNGTKFCSAMDHLICNTKQHSMFNTSNSMTNDQHIDTIESNRFEMIKRLPCLPSHIDAYETVSIFLGLIDERFPAYAVPGSYFCGAIGFYHSKLLHNLVTYPFRLILDNSNIFSSKPNLIPTSTATSITTTATTTTTTTAAAATVTSTTTFSLKKLFISYIGLSMEDLQWIQCLGELFLFNSNSMKSQSNKNVNSFNNNSHQNNNSDYASEPTVHTSIQLNHQLEESHAINHHSSLDLCKNLVNEVKTLSNNHEIITSVAEDLTDECKDWNSVTYSNHDVTIEQKTELNTLTQSSVNETYSQLNEHNTSDSMNNIIVEKQIDTVKISNTIECNDNTSMKQTNTSTCSQSLSETTTPSLKSTIEYGKNPTSCKVNNNSYTSDEFSVILYKLHLDLCKLDKPFTATMNNDDNHDNTIDRNNNNNLCTLLRERFKLWYDVDCLINNGQLINSNETLNLLNGFFDKFSSESSIQKKTTTPWRHFDIPITDSSTCVQENNLLYHLLNISLPASNNNSVTPPTKKTLKNTNSATIMIDASNQSASSCSVNLSLNVDCRQSSSPLSQLESLDGNVNSQTTQRIANSVPNNHQKPLKITSNEFKLRLIDVLTRYGRIIAERLICLNYLQNQLIHSNKNHWSLYSYVQSQIKMISSSNNHLDQQLPSSSSSSICCFELIQYLDKIYERLMKLITQTIVSTDSIGFNVQLGNQALPNWLLLSTDYKTTDDDNDEKLSTMNAGSIGGRLMIFLILYMIIKQQYAELIYYFVRVLYQIVEPPVGAFKGIVNCGFPSSSTCSFGVLRQCHATLENSLMIMKSTFPWLLWLLHQIDWIDLASYLNQQAPMLFPQRDYSLLSDNNDNNN
ncbi:unnamed protein product [Schistosoma turkestanicum]|nr:unnamed protein product [Schistosoma turkestanicum]